MQDGKLVVSRERRRGVEHVLLPGGRVQAGEAITEALVREVAEETGLDVLPERLLYVAEVVGSYGVHDLNLVWLAEPRDAQLADPAP
jgi:8-oxo-dGTP diphosphatase